MGNTYPTVCAQERIVETTWEVWKAIKEAHPEPQLCVFASYSHPDGDPHGNPNKGAMYTRYGFRNQNTPIMEALTTWDIDREKPIQQERYNVVHRYWLVMYEEVDCDE